MKRILSIILILCMVFSFAGCGTTSQSNKQQNDVTNTEPLQEEPAEEICVRYKFQYYRDGDCVGIGSKLNISVVIGILVNGELSDKCTLTPEHELFATFKDIGGGAYEVTNITDDPTYFTIDSGKTKITLCWTMYNQKAELDESGARSHSNYNQVYYSVGEYWIPNPKTDEDYLNNVAYAIISENYLCYPSVDTYDWKISAEDAKPYLTAHLDFFDINDFSGSEFCFNKGQLFICRSDENGGLIDKTKLANKLYKFLLKCSDKHMAVHKSNKFSAQTDVLEIVNRYLKQTYSFAPNELNGFISMMDMENIEAYGLLMTDNKSGKEFRAAYIPLDGEEYIASPSGSHKGLIKLAEAEDKWASTADAESLELVRKEAQRGYYNTRLRLEDFDGITMKTLPEGEAATGVTYKELAAFYCDNENLSYIENPTCQEDHYNNLCFLILTGQWDYQDIYVSDNQYKWISQSLKSVSNIDVEKNIHTKAAVDPALLGYFINGTGNIVAYYDGSAYHLSTGYLPLNLLVQPSEMQRQVIEAYLFAKAKYTEFREAGLITDSSSEYEIAKVYADWFSDSHIIQYEWPGGDGENDGPPTQYEGCLSFYTASAHSAFFTRNAICAGRTSAMVLLMKMEGIKSFGVTCGSVRQGEIGAIQTSHIVPWMLLDGKEYIYEYANGMGLNEVDKTNYTVPNCGHALQIYVYNLLLKDAGLEYSEEMLTRTTR